MGESEIPERFRKYWEDRTDSGHRFKDENWHKENAEELVRLFPARGTLLDVGCGDAKILTYLAPHFNNVIGIDISNSMLGQAKKRAKKCGVSNIRFEQGDACHFPDSVGKADLILSYQVAQFLDPKEISRHLQECKRVLNQEGMVGICSIPWANLRFFYGVGGLGKKIFSPMDAMLCHYWHMTRRILSVLKRGSLSVSLGFWHSHDQIKDLARAEGFSSEIVTSWYYEYRFHVVLSLSDT